LKTSECLKCKKDDFSGIQIGFEDIGAVNPSTGKKIWKLEELREDVLEMDQQWIEYLYLLLKPPEEYLPKQQVEVE
jgi:hypothetical protein